MGPGWPLVTAEFATEPKEGVRSVLSAAALTYVAGVASAAGYIIYLVFLGGRWLFRKPPVA